MGDACDLKFQVVLIRPEPRHLCILQIFAANIAGDGLRLFKCVVHRFKAQSLAQQAVGVIGAVTDCIHRRVTGSAAIINAYTVVNVETGIFGKFNIRQNPDANQCEIGSYRCAIREFDLFQGSTSREPGKSRR